MTDFMMITSLNHALLFCAQLRKYLLRPSCMIYHQQHRCHGQSINLVSIRLPLLMHKDNELLCRPPLFNTSVSPSPLHTPRRQPQRPTAGMTCPRSTPAYAIELDQSSDEEPEAYTCSSRKKLKLENAMLREKLQVVIKNKGTITTYAFLLGVCNFVKPDTT